MNLNLKIEKIIFKIKKIEKILIKKLKYFKKVNIYKIYTKVLIFWKKWINYK